MFCEFVVVPDIYSVCSLVAVGLLTNVGCHFLSDGLSRWRNTQTTGLA